ncbi:kelch repeat protein [Ostertagia ostertagi]
MAERCSHEQGVGIAALNKLLYAVGGRDGNTYLKSVERFDPTTEAWSSDIAPMSHNRSALGVAMLDDFIYAVGGTNGTALSVVERYDPRQNQWTRKASMGTWRCALSVSVLNGCLYAVGGWRGSPRSTVERFDPRVGKWEYLRTMTTCRAYLGCAALEGHLYAVGGQQGSTYLSSAEKFNPLTNEWTAVADMNEKRSGVARPFSMEGYTLSWA